LLAAFLGAFVLSVILFPHGLLGELLSRLTRPRRAR